MTFSPLSRYFIRGALPFFCATHLGLLSSVEEDHSSEEDTLSEPVSIELTEPLIEVEESSVAFFPGIKPTRMQEAMLRDLDNIRNIFQSQYAPIHWKKAYKGWELDTAIREAKEKVLGAHSVKSYQIILRDFFNSLEDYHVKVRFYSTEEASLPFQLGYADGGYYIQYVDRKKLSPLFYPINVGDELISFDGRPIEEVIQELKRVELSSEKEGTDHSLACRLLTKRSGAQGAQVPRGPVMIEVRSPFSKVERSYQLIWEYTPERVKDVLDPDAAPEALVKKGKKGLRGSGDSKRLQSLVEQAILGGEMNTALQFSEELRGDQEGLGNPHDIGARKSFIPPLGRMLMEAGEDEEFYWYLCESEDRSRRVGYVRIPFYVPRSMNIEKALQEFAVIIERMQELSDVLVIDQVNNPGGNKWYLAGLASMLTDQPLYAPKDRMAIDQFWVHLSSLILDQFEGVETDEDAEEVFGGKSMMGMPINYQTVVYWREWCRFIIDQWGQGKTLTDPMYIMGMDKIHPHPRVRYTKPIVLLVNELCFSCGDFFPAILSDSKDKSQLRIFGARTAGAGGFVRWHQYPNAFGVYAFSLTGSLAERVDKNPIENLGVQPDVEYALSRYDMQFNYVEYVQAVQELIDELMEDGSGEGSMLSSRNWGSVSSLGSTKEETLKSLFDEVAPDLRRRR